MSNLRSLACKALGLPATAAQADMYRAALTKIALSVAVGTKVYWYGDFSNNEGRGTVTASNGSYITVKFDDGRVISMPEGVLSTPRWKILS